MKFSSLIIALAALISIAPEAKALPVNFTGSNVKMGYVDIGQSGVITGITSSTSNRATGTIPANSVITFTYDIKGSTNSVGTAYGSYVDLLGSSIYSGSSLDGSNWTTAPVNHAQVDGVDSTNQLIFATATWISNSEIMTSITNNSGFEAFFISLVATAMGNINTAAYSVNPVPLPAALPMFGAALFGLGCLRKRKQVNAA